MNGILLKKFIDDNLIEWHRHTNLKDDKEDVIILVNFGANLFTGVSSDLEILAGKLSTYLEEEGIPCFLKDGHVSIWASDICTPLGIKINDVFVDKEGWESREV